MNPYDFVPFESPIERDRPCGHHRLNGYTGRFTCQLEALTPFLVMDGDRRPVTGTTAAGEPMCGADGQYLIPGTSLKGMVRSVFEVLVPSCVVLKGNHDLVPDELTACTQQDCLCPACRVFGIVGRGQKGAVLRGRVHIGEARAEGRLELMAPVQLVPLGSPQPRHTVFYKPDGEPAGRKFYFHHHWDLRPEPSNENERNRGPWVRPLAPGSRFVFHVAFENLTKRQLEGLVASLVLADAAPLDDEQVKVRHKLGYGKPAGLGSVAVRLLQAELWENPSDRYRGYQRSPALFEDSNLETFVSTCQQAFFQDPTPAVEKLIRILRYPPPAGVRYAYPSFEWFQQNPDKRLHETP